MPTPLDEVLKWLPWAATLVSTTVAVLGYINNRRNTNRESRPIWRIEDADRQYVLRPLSDKIRLERARLEFPVAFGCTHAKFLGHSGIHAANDGVITNRKIIEDGCIAQFDSTIGRNMALSFAKLDAMFSKSTSEFRHSAQMAVPVVLETIFSNETDRLQQFAVYDLLLDMEYQRDRKVPWKMRVVDIYLRSRCRTLSGARRDQAKYWIRWHWDENIRRPTLWQVIRARWAAFVRDDGIKAPEPANSSSDRQPPTPGIAP